jgi:hypothetical protein
VSGTVNEAVNSETGAADPMELVERIGLMLFDG